MGQGTPRSYVIKVWWQQSFGFVVYREAGSIGGEDFNDRHLGNDAKGVLPLY